MYMYSTIQSYLSRPRKKKIPYAIYNEVIHILQPDISCHLRARTRRTKRLSCFIHNEIKKKDDMILFERHNALGTTMLGITRPNHTQRTDCTECIM